MASAPLEDAVVVGLSPAEALERVQRSGMIVCLGVPLGLEFGIDLRSYSVGPRFGGVKMVPTRGVHFVACGTELSTTGLFIQLAEAEVCVLRWDTDTEVLQLVEDSAAAEPHVAAARGMRSDSGLGAYPLATEAQWRALSAHVTPAVLERAAIPLGALLAPEGIDEAALEAEIDRLERARSGADEVASGARPSRRAPPMGPHPEPAPSDIHGAKFVQLDPRTSGRGRSGAALSRFHLDRSEWLDELLATDYAEAATGAAGGGCVAADAEMEESGSDDADADADGATDRGAGGATVAARRGVALAPAERALLGELQLAFVLFLRLASLRALEQWKALVDLLSSCESALVERGPLYAALLATVRAQLELAPADLLDGEGLTGENNFLRTALGRLARAAVEAGETVPPRVAEELNQLQRLVGERFGLTLEALGEEEDDEDAPMVVEEESA